MVTSDYTFSFGIIEKFSSYTNVVQERGESSKLEVSHEQWVMSARTWMIYI